MTKKTLFNTLLFCALFIFFTPLMASDDETSVEKKQVFGWQLMSPEEQSEHRMKMSSFKNQTEKDEYRRKHHQRMQERAEAKGVTLPVEPRGMAVID